MGMVATLWPDGSGVLKSKFHFLYVNDLGPRSRINIDRQSSHTFINTISCLHLPTFRWQAAIVSESEDQWSCKRSPDIDIWA